MNSFFDPALLEAGGVAFIREDKVDEALRLLIPNAHITKGSFTCPGYSEPRDLLWNHMDQMHRPYIHRTYNEAARISIGRRTAFSLTRFGRWPAVIPVFDGHFRENGFYQILCLFGLIVVVNVIECKTEDAQTRMEIGWAIASHRLLRFLHPWLHRRLIRLNIVQNAEDEEIRKRRTELRASNYRFMTDAPDFVNANVKSNNVVYPPLAKGQSFPIGEPDGKPRQIDVGDRMYIIRHLGETVEVFPGVCPHEGAHLGPDDVKGGTVKCRWHGLEFGPRRLKRGDPAVTVCGARLELYADTLRITPTEAVSS